MLQLRQDVATLQDKCKHAEVSDACVFVKVTRAAACILHSLMNAVLGLNQQPAG